jgi:hypothetical protein
VRDANRKNAETADSELTGRLEREVRKNPSGHGQQSPPRKQKEIADAAEHDDDRARARVDPKTLKDLKE